VAAFPDLFGARRRRQAAIAAASIDGDDRRRRRRRRRGTSAAVSRRMKKYWADRRKTKRKVEGRAAGFTAQTEFVRTKLRLVFSETAALQRHSVVVGWHLA